MATGLQEKAVRCEDGAELGSSPNLCQSCGPFYFLSYDVYGHPVQSQYFTKSSSTISQDLASHAGQSLGEDPKCESQTLVWHGGGMDGGTLEVHTDWTRSFRTCRAPRCQACQATAHPSSRADHGHHLKPDVATRSGTSTQ